jgi:putative endonuclease
MPVKRSIGDAAEKLAEKFLKQRGYKLLQQNFSCRYGEIDLIMLSPDEEIVFIEVRYRKSEDFGGAKASITESKQRKIQKTAEYYLQQHEQDNAICRCDTITITSRGDAPHIEWLENAF